MKHDMDLHDDEFFDEVQKTQQKMALLGFAATLFFFLLTVTTIYFFLAAAGIVPPLDVIPLVPYV